jgi:hypothetical protein
MQRKECSCASIELAKRSVSSRMATTDKISHGLEISRGKSFGLFTRSSLIGTLMRAAFFIAAIPISASAQTPEQIAAMQAQIAAQQAQKNADRALQAQLDAISQRDALQALQEDTTLATSEALPVTLPPAAASPSPSPAETRVETTPVQEGGTDATPRQVVLEQDGGAATPDKVPEGGARSTMRPPPSPRLPPGPKR